MVQIFDTIIAVWTILKIIDWRNLMDLQFSNDSGPNSHNVGPRRLVDSVVHEAMHLQFANNHLLSQKSKFRHALDTLQEDYRPSETVSCRDNQKQQIQNYLRSSLTTYGTSESLYVSGVPGIGKTLCVQEVVGKLEKEMRGTVKVIYTNALCLKKPKDIFRTIYYELTGHLEDPDSAMCKLNKYFERGEYIDPGLKRYNNYKSQFDQDYSDKSKEHQYLKMKKVVILDELDYLKTRDEDVLYNIFEWTQKRRSRLIIISISNTTNLPDYLSPKVNSRIGNQRLVFPHYESHQIEKILRERISHLDVFDDQAITFTCKKIAQCSSDIRKSLNVLREAIYEFLLVEKKNKKHLKDDDIKNKRINVEILSRVMDNIYRDLFVTSFTDFPPSYKVVLYFLAKHFRNQSGSCSLRQLQYLSTPWRSEYNQLMPTLIDLKELGIINIHYLSVKKEKKFSNQFINMKQLRQEHITLQITYERIIYALQKQNLSELSKNNFKIDLNF